MTIIVLDDNVCGRYADQGTLSAARLIEQVVLGRMRTHGARTHRGNRAEINRGQRKPRFWMNS